MKQFVCCSAAGQHLTIEVLSVREVIGPPNITPVPLGPREVRGLINLRGRIISVLDLSACVGGEAQALHDDVRIVVLRTSAEIEQIRLREHRHDLAAPDEPMGLLIDTLGDIVSVDEDQIEAPPANFSLSGIGFIDCVTSVGNTLYGIVDVGALLDVVTGERAAA